MFFGKLTNFINKELTQLTREVRAGHNKIFEDIEYLTKIVQAIKNKVGDSDLYAKKREKYTIFSRVYESLKIFFKKWRKTHTFMKNFV